jgi:hypothetical protein
VRRCGKEIERERDLQTLSYHPVENHDPHGGQLGVTRSTSEESV